ncbi:MAG: hypothetical protein KKG75_00585 [Nanoarchaeota archaeon]|nr:hypothetical protein [Nanoarchaeota archaeon]
MAEGEGMGIGTLVNAIVIFLVIIGVIWVHGEMFGGSRKALEEFFDLGEIKNVAQDVFSTERDITLNTTHIIADKIVELLMVKENDCLINLDFSGFDDSFVVEFKESTTGNSLLEVSKGRVAVQRRLTNNVFFMNSRNFKIKEFDKIEINGIEYPVKIGDKIILFKDINSNFYFYAGNELAAIRNTKLSCGQKKVSDQLAQQRIEGGIGSVEYYLSMMQVYYNDGKYDKVLDAYYSLYRGSEQGTLVVSAEQLEKMNTLWINSVNQMGSGARYLCEDKNGVFRCFDFSYYEYTTNLRNGILQNCKDEILIPVSIKYGNLEDCEKERLTKIGILPRI